MVIPYGTNYNPRQIISEPFISLLLAETELFHLHESAIFRCNTWAGHQGGNFSTWELNSTRLRFQGTDPDPYCIVQRQISSDESKHFLAAARGISPYACPQF